MTGLALDAREGRGCHHCEVGVPVERITTRHATIELCVECVLLWFPGKSVQWWEARHSPYRDHVGDALARSHAAELRGAVRKRSTDSLDGRRDGATGRPNPLTGRSRNTTVIECV